MTKETSGKEISKNKTKRFGVFELRISKLRFPRRKGNKSKDFATKAKDVVQKLHDIELSLEFHLSNIKNYKSVLFSKRRSNSRPMNLRYLRNLSTEVEGFDNDYENYCLRAYIYRETVWHFIAEFLNIKDQSFYRFLDDSKTRDTGITKVLEAFDKNANLKSVIETRNRITHKLRGENGVKEKTIDDIIKKFSVDLRRVNSSLDKIVEIHSRVADRINEHTK